MQAKFNMTQQENIFLAKRNIVDYIWKSANLEGIGVTYRRQKTHYTCVYFEKSQRSNLGDCITSLAGIKLIPKVLANSTE